MLQLPGVCGSSNFVNPSVDSVATPLLSVQSSYFFGNWNRFPIVLCIAKFFAGFFCLPHFRRFALQAKLFSYLILENPPFLDHIISPNSALSLFVLPFSNIQGFYGYIPTEEQQLVRPLDSKQM